ncbi:sensor histidine kinase [Candidatus Solirubrobacter pratensis]|uniref:sensor histidine kinase n=1 Tax=Candidatus Solirubrobacter pratensis TaxID=1298857 RepID=UPI0003FEC9AB|nr:HAMP domain-containing sensor histidine kinase [Candidatus Solirubrobacter pratensis]
MTLRHRIAAVAGAAVAVAVLAAAAVIYLALRADLLGEIDSALHERSEQFVHDPDPDRDGDQVCASNERSFPAPAPGSDDLRFGGAGGFIQIACRDGTIVRAAGATTTVPLTPAARAIARSGRGSDVSTQAVGDTSLRVLTTGTGAGAVQVARPLGEADHELDRIVAVLAIVAAAGVALAAALGALVARTALAPIDRFTRRTEALSHDPDVSERMEVRGGDELARLARSFNTTLDALERSVEAQRHLVADASHELRTPMASLRANIQTLEAADELPEEDRAALRADIVGELDELTALVADVVELARGSTPERALDDVRLDRVVRALVERPRVRAAEFRLSLEPTVVQGEPDRVSRAVSNLLDNAIKWSPADRAIDVELREGILSVRDHGPGFAPADLPHVFERFFRAGGARGMPGSGLGLAIVKQAAEAHGGWVTAANAPGGGALLRIRFGD